MNYYRLAMKVFKEHKSDFIKLAVKREKQKQRRYMQRHNYDVSPEEIAKAELEIKAEMEKINKLIGGFLK